MKQYKYTINGNKYEVAIGDIVGNVATLTVNGEEFKVDRPRRTLEEFFLDVIAKARAESVETAGVAGGGRIAEYLAKGDESSAVLASLVGEEPAAAAPQPTEKQREEAPELSERIRELTGEPAPQPEQPAEPARSDEAELSAANAKLNDLLGGKRE